jgi:Mycothiol maleylpyruvate isomerase N-terminal domain
MGDLLDRMEAEGARLGAAARAALDVMLVSCPEWRGRDLLAHVCGFTRYVRGALAGTTTPEDDVPAVDPGAAVHDWDGDPGDLVAALRVIPAEVPVWNLSVAPHTAAYGRDGPPPSWPCTAGTPRPRTPRP